MSSYLLHKGHWHLKKLNFKRGVLSFLNTCLWSPHQGPSSESKFLSRLNSHKCFQHVVWPMTHSPCFCSCSPLILEGVFPRHRGSGCWAFLSRPSHTISRSSALGASPARQLPSIHPTHPHNMSYTGSCSFLWLLWCFSLYHWFLSI